jgi:hypothetical protein
VPSKLTLPKPVGNYNPKAESETRRLIELEFLKTQPRQNPVTVTGAKAGNAALTSLIEALVTLGFIVDGTT